MDNDEKKIERAKIAAMLVQAMARKDMSMEAVISSFKEAMKVVLSETMTQV